MKGLLWAVTEKCKIWSGVAEVSAESNQPIQPYSNILVFISIFQLSSGSVIEIWLQMQGDEPKVMYHFLKKVDEAFYESQAE